MGYTKIPSNPSGAGKLDVEIVLEKNELRTTIDLLKKVAERLQTQGFHPKTQAPASARASPASAPGQAQSANEAADKLQNMSLGEIYCTCKPSQPSQHGATW